MMQAENPFQETPEATAPTKPPGGPTSPFVRVEQPRLGISHLLVWTACVAVYFSIMRTLQTLQTLPAGFAEPSAFELVWSVVYGIAGGAAIGGLVLFVARRYRGRPFPVHPGETLLVVLGAGRVLSLAMLFLGCYLAAVGQPASLRFSWQIIFVLGCVGYVVIYLVAALRTKVVRWRRYFFTAAVATAVPCCGLVGVPFRMLVSPMYITRGAYVVGFIILSVVVLMDLSQRIRYPWTHWVGVGTAFVSGTTNILWLLWMMFSRMASF